jgi:hypothetical protein
MVDRWFSQVFYYNLSVDLGELIGILIFHLGLRQSSSKIFAISCINLHKLFDQNAKDSQYLCSKNQTTHKIQNKKRVWKKEEVFIKQN